MFKIIVRSRGNNSVKLNYNNENKLNNNPIINNYISV